MQPPQVFDVESEARCPQAPAPRVTGSSVLLFEQRGGNSRQILVSIRDKLLSLDDSLIVIPGHGELTTIGRERQFNYFLQGL
jgi:glyoxylase-like metal-dependent hydrolase (beta-lactamase superfamily II)